MSLEQRLSELQIVLPELAPLGNYCAAVKAGRLLHVSGQLPKSEGRIQYIGRVGREVTLEAARKAARLCVINALAVIKSELGSLDKVKRIVKVNGYVTSAVGFREQHKVMDAASELLVDVFGAAGRHARSAVGVVELPLGAAVELDLVCEI